jgi:DHA1 family bicyclomycin/chloramphenicol resistance-like MFS transporter
MLLWVADWRAIFWVLAGYAALLAAVVLLALPETLPEDRRLGHGVGGVARTYAALLRDRRFLGYALSGGLPMAGMFAYIGGSPFVFMELHGIPADRYGLFFGLNAFGIMLVAQANARAARRFPAPVVLGWVLAGMAATGLALLVVALTGAGGFPAVAVLLFVYVSGIGAAMPLASALAMGPQGQRAGSASAIIGTLQFGLGAAAGALVGLAHDGTAVPMAAVIAGAGLGALAVRRVLLR